MFHVCTVISSIVLVHLAQGSTEVAAQCENEIDCAVSGSAMIQVRSSPSQFFIADPDWLTGADASTGESEATVESAGADTNATSVRTSQEGGTSVDLSPDEGKGNKLASTASDTSKGTGSTT